MATNSFTIQFVSTCAGSNHIRAVVTVNGTRTFDLNIERDEVLGNNFDVEPEDVVKTLIRNFVKEGAFANIATARTAIEAHTFKI